MLLAPTGVEQAHIVLELRLAPSARPIYRPSDAGAASDQDDGADALWIGGGEHASHVTTLADAEDRRLL